MTAFFVREPDADAIPLLVSIPHSGTEVPDEIARRFAAPDVGALPDTDFHLEKLYDFVPSLGARTIHARFSRYVVDLNRPPSGEALYAGRSGELVPTLTFAGDPIYGVGAAPDEGERAERVAAYFRPYHARIRAELDDLRSRFGYALLFDAHSIKSVVPRLFAGQLPGLMLGDVDGTSAAHSISERVLAVHAASGTSFRPNDPFKGGFITRQYGRPREGVHALQLEMSQRLYMEEGAPFTYRPDLAAKIASVLRNTLRAMVEAAKEVA